MIDLITTLEGEKDLSKYTLSLHRCIVQSKTAYYSFYLPVACVLLTAGENLDNHVDVKNILVEMGTYFQVQDDYLDCFPRFSFPPGTIGCCSAGECGWRGVKKPSTLVFNLSFGFLFHSTLLSLHTSCNSSRLAFLVFLGYVLKPLFPPWDFRFSVCPD